MERQFHTQFFIAKLKICLVELSRVTQRGGESIESFITRFKRIRNRCKIHLLETEYVKIAQRGLDIELWKKFQGMDFRDFYELAIKVTKYEELLKEESQRRKTSMGTYCQEVNYEEIVVADFPSTGSFIFPLLVKKRLTYGRSHRPPLYKHNILLMWQRLRKSFDFLLKEKFISFSQDHQLPSKEKLKGKVYWNHGTNSCWSFRNIIEDRINKGILNFLEKMRPWWLMKILSHQWLQST